MTIEQSGFDSYSEPAYAKDYTNTNEGIDVQPSNHRGIIPSLTPLVTPELQEPITGLSAISPQYKISDKIYSGLDPLPVSTRVLFSIYATRFLGVAPNVVLEGLTQKDEIIVISVERINGDSREPETPVASVAICNYNIKDPTTLSGGFLGDIPGDTEEEKLKILLHILNLEDQDRSLPAGAIMEVGRLAIDPRLLKDNLIAQLAINVLLNKSLDLILEENKERLEGKKIERVTVLTSKQFYESFIIPTFPSIELRATLLQLCSTIPEFVKNFICHYPKYGLNPRFKGVDIPTNILTTDEAQEFLALHSIIRTNKDVKTDEYKDSIERLNFYLGKISSFWKKANPLDSNSIELKNLAIKLLKSVVNPDIGIYSAETSQLISDVSGARPLVE